MTVIDAANRVMHYGQNFLKITERLGLITVKMSINTQHGLLIPYVGRMVVIYTPDMDSWQLAHLLGHCVLHKGVQGGLLVPCHGKIKEEADEFAVEWLRLCRNEVAV